MDLEAFTIAVYCLVDELLAELHADPDWRRVRTRGPAPTLDDAEVIRMEVFGEFLGYDQDAAIFRSFRQHHAEWFPALPRVLRTTFTRQAAKLWAVTHRPWGLLLEQAAARSDPLGG